MSKVYRSKLMGFPKIKGYSSYPDEHTTRGGEYASGATQRVNVSSYPSDRTTGKGQYAPNKSMGTKFNSYPSPKGKTEEIAPCSYAKMPEGKSDSEGNKQSQGTRATIVRMGQHENVTIK